MFLMSIILISSLALAGEKIEVKVSGLVCPLCFSKVESKFKELSQVQTIKVEMDQKMLILELKDGQKLSDEEIYKVIDEDSGYKITGVHRG